MVIIIRIYHGTFNYITYYINIYKQTKLVIIFTSIYISSNIITTPAMDVFYTIPAGTIALTIQVKSENLEIGTNTNNTLS